ncbi:protein trichome birefringence-like 26 isoform X2 [Phalaenopsis equestris]|uniref:protein trichome birefringence-like 26 isoform X2 n=1 Tax=Phalaenopsis equestris TaxID=78828 RepID=UPI0009E45839|nr:protein trichome birefringence-like 26 isoform X2 [Phalaenopsis equestris]
MAGDEVQEPRHSPLRKGLYTLFMIFIAILSITFTYYLLFSNSSGSDLTSCPAFAGSSPAISRRDQGGQCDIFSGQWLSDPSGPAYTNLSCNFIESPQNCLRNGRPDKDYLYWRWKPYGCELPPFDPFKFMDAMKDKTWAYIGDSIFRNHMQSMICLLSKVEEPVEVYHDKTYKSRTWYFVNHNFTISLIWTPFLVKSELFEDDEGKAKSEVHLHLDILDDKWTSQYNKYDYVIFSGGQWFLKAMILWVHNTTVGCHNCNNHNLKELGVYCPYRKALQTVYEFMTSSDHKPLIFFRTWTPDHFEYGEWFSGGICNRTRPYSEGEYNGKPIDHVMRTIEIEEFDKATLMASKSGARLKLLDTFHLSVLRPDGHPGPYRTFNPFDKDKTAKVQNDCLHWCLPGPIDTWNELVMKILFDESGISYS